MMPFLLSHSFSSLIGRETYFGYYVDCFSEALGATSFTLTLLTTGSLYLGIYLYINGMADDLQATVEKLDQVEPEDMWATYVEEIRFHNEITGYVIFSISSILDNSTISINLHVQIFQNSNRCEHRNESAAFCQSAHLCNGHCIQSALVRSVRSRRFISHYFCVQHGLGCNNDNNFLPFIGAYYNSTIED